MTGSAWHQARGSCRGTSLLPRPFRSSLGSMNRLLRLTGMISFRRSPLPRLGASRSIPGFTVPRALQATLLEDHYLLTLPIPASSCRHDQVPQVDRRVQVPVMPGAACVASPGSFPLQFRVHGAAGAAGPAAGEPHGASHLGVPPLALSFLIACRLSISAPPGASLGFPRERPPTPGTRGRQAISTWGNRAGR